MFDSFKKWWSGDTDVETKSENTMDLPEDSVTTTYKPRVVSFKEYEEAVIHLSTMKSEFPISQHEYERIDVVASQLVKLTDKDLYVFMTDEDWRTHLPKTDEAILSYVGNFHRITKFKVPKDKPGMSRCKLMLIGDGGMIFLLIDRADEEKGVDSLTFYNKTKFINEIKKSQRDTDCVELTGLDPYKEEAFTAVQSVK